MIMYAGKQKCSECGVICSENRTGKCKECSKVKCPFPGCEAIFQPRSGKTHCNVHQRIKNKEEYVSKMLNGAVDLRRHRILPEEVFA